MLKLITELDQKTPDYVEAVRTCADLLEEVINLLRDHGFSIAICGVWRTWSEEQAPNATVDISEEMLRESGDANVVALLNLSRELAATRDALRATVV